MTDTTFSIVYDGEPVAEGTIDARDLAPALLAFADLVDEAAPLIDPNLPRISVRVRPDFQKGSFEVYLELANLYAADSIPNRNTVVEGFSEDLVRGSPA